MADLKPVIGVSGEEVVDEESGELSLFCIAMLDKEDTSVIIPSPLSIETHRTLDPVTGPYLSLRLRFKY